MNAVEQRICELYGDVSTKVKAARQPIDTTTPGSPSQHAIPSTAAKLLDFKFTEPPKNKRSAQARMLFFCRSLERQSSWRIKPRKYDLENCYYDSHITMVHETGATISVRVGSAKYSSHDRIVFGGGTTATMNKSASAIYREFMRATPKALEESYNSIAYKRKETAKRLAILQVMRRLKPTGTIHGTHPRDWSRYNHWIIRGICHFSAKPHYNDGEWRCELVLTSDQLVWLAEALRYRPQETQENPEDE